MYYSLESAILDFRKNYVDIESDRSTKARSSRDWLISQINKLSDDGKIPILYKERNLEYGSFARKTKIRPLNDIDLMIAYKGFSNYGTYYQENYDNITIYCTSEAPILGNYIDDNNLLNSRKILNNLKSELSSISYYQKAELHRNQEAVTLQLSSYEWNFDIVPCFYTVEGFYLIPDGYGNWKKTDPRIDQKRITNINQKFDGKILPLIRLMKYWKEINGLKDKLMSYAFETMILDYFEREESICEDTTNNLYNIFVYIKDAINNKIIDPKDCDTNLNGLSYEEKDNFVKKVDASINALLEITLETLKDNDINKKLKEMRKILGVNFPINN